MNRFPKNDLVIRENIKRQKNRENHIKFVINILIEAESVDTTILAMNYVWILIQIKYESQIVIRETNKDAFYSFELCDEYKTCAT